MHGRFLRLAWEADAPSPSSPRPDRRRALPAGEYTLIAYRLVRRTDDGGAWFLSATAPHLREIAVRAGEEQRIAVNDAVLMNARVVAQQDGFQIQMTIQGENRSGLSIYRDGRRIPIGYRIAGPHGHEIAHGRMNYG